MLTKNEILKCCLLIAVLLVLLVLAAGSGEVEGKTITVDDDGGADYEKIQDAIDNAVKGDTVFVHNGYYEENVWVNKTLTLLGENREKVTISGGNESSVITIQADGCFIKHVTIKNGGMEHRDAGVDLKGNNITLSHIAVEFIKNGIYSYGGYHELNIDNSSIKSTTYGLHLNNFVNTFLERVDLTENDYGSYLSSCREFQTDKCNIHGNTDWGVYSSSGINIYAKNCWWGHKDGPSTEYPYDKGDKIHGVDEYGPYLRACPRNQDSHFLHSIFPITVTKKGGSFVHMS